ncbi:MAG: hypothetical protein AAF547_06040 [Actinomycetota bacterium]
MDVSVDQAGQAFHAEDPVADAAIRTALASLVSPGSFFTGAERAAIATHARLARGLATSAPELPPVVAEAAARVAADAISTRPSHIAAWEADGRDVVAYVELVAVTALICSIDSYRIGLGVPLDQLPDPVPGDPVPAVAEEARKTNAWVPTVGVALAPTAMSALPNETATKAAVSKEWYLTDQVVHQYAVEPGRELSRPQMELVAARTSWLNECFF